MVPTTLLIPAQTARFAGTNPERQSVGLPGHCDRCAGLDHVTAHPDFGCGDVGCSKSPGPAEKMRVFLTGGLAYTTDRSALAEEHELVISQIGEDARDLIGSCQAVVADASTPSITTGLHIAHARAIGIPIVLVAVGRMPDLEVLDAGTEIVLLSEAEMSPHAVVSAVRLAFGVAVLPVSA